MIPKKLQELLEKAQGELTLLYEIGNALRTTLDFDETLYIILTGVTAHHGLGFNRACIFLVNPAAKQLEGRMWIGPETGEEAQAIWGEIQNRRLTLHDLIANYDSGRALQASPFHKTVLSLKVPLTERAGGMVALAALQGMPFELVNPEEQAKAAQDPVLRVFKSTSCLVVPLKGRNGNVVGVIFADNRITMKPITRESFRLLALLAAHAGLAIENAWTYQVALRQADLDSLTELWNRGAFQRTLMETLARAEQIQQHVAIIFHHMKHITLFTQYANVCAVGRSQP